MTWNQLILEETQKEYFKDLEAFLSSEVEDVFPPIEDRFKAFELTPYEKVKVVVLGQDPYHGPHQAMGLSFSVHPGMPLPKSLINIYKELYDDLGITKITGDLSGWAKQGVFLLNTILSVRKSSPLSHQNKGWEVFTDTVINTLNLKEEPIIFVLWGKTAQEKEKMISDHHICIKSAHPSPLSAYRGFFGSKPFSTINDILIERGQSPIDWSL